MTSGALHSGARVLHQLQHRDITTCANRRGQLHQHDNICSLHYENSLFFLNTNDGVYLRVKNNSNVEKKKKSYVPQYNTWTYTRYSWCTAKIIPCIGPIPYSNTGSILNHYIPKRCVIRKKVYCIGYTFFIGSPTVHKNMSWLWKKWRYAQNFANCWIP